MLFMEKLKSDAPENGGSRGFIVCKSRQEINEGLQPSWVYDVIKKYLGFRSVLADRFIINPGHGLM